jgi:hypothetical protein
MLKPSLWRVWRQGRAGKSALARALAGEGFKETESTVGVEQRLMEVTPAALDVVGATGVWRRARDCDGTGTISAAAAAAQLAACKLACRQQPAARGVAAAWAAAASEVAEMSDLLEGMDGGHISGRAPNPLHEPAALPLLSRDPLAVPAAGGGVHNFGGSGQGGNESQGKTIDRALSEMDRELVLKLAQDEGAGKTAALRLSLWDYGGQKVLHIVQGHEATPARAQNNKDEQ